MDDADSFVSKAAEEIRLIVYPFRKGSPILVSDIMTKMQNHDVIRSLNTSQFNELLIRLVNQGFLAGIVFEGNRVYIDEEHFSWKAKIYQKSKEEIAAKAISYINSGHVVALDSGSTTLQVARNLCQGLRMRIWDNLKIVTNSIPAANELLSTSSELGLTDPNSILSVYMVGGRIRPNTLAVVNVETESSKETDFAKILDDLGGADISFVGANGILKDVGVTTHRNSETQTKSDILKHSRKRYILADSSKFGIEEEVVFATFDDELEIITDQTTNPEIVLECQRFLKQKGAATQITVI